MRTGIITVGYPHSCIRFWDLRYLFNHRLIFLFDEYLSFPSFIASTSNIVYNSLIDSGFTKNRIAKLESLRYSWLSADIEASFTNNIISVDSNLTILILLDYKINSTRLLLDCAYSLRKSFPSYSFILRQHPSCLINECVPDSQFTISSQSFADDLRQCDLVISSCSTTAALEAYLCRKFVIILLEIDSLHYGPLRSINYPHIARNIAHVIDMVNQFEVNNDFSQIYHEDLIHTNDSNLPLWSDIIDLY